MPDYYDPAAQLAGELAAVLKDKSECIKIPAVYFDGHNFIVNKASMGDTTAIGAENAARSLGFILIDNGKEDFYHFCLSNDWICGAISEFPEFTPEKLGVRDNALATRMQAHIEFGFRGPWIEESYGVALLLFKAINTKSESIRGRIAGEAFEAIEEHLRKGFLPAELTLAVKNAVHMLNIYNRGFIL